MTGVNFNAGYNAGARSIKWVTGDAEMTVEPREDLVGAFVGFSPAVDVTLPHEQTHAFHFSYSPAGGAMAYIYERGSLVTTVGAYSEGDVFKIRRVEGVVTYYVNDVLEHTSEVPSIGTVFLAAALYMAGDRI